MAAELQGVAPQIPIDYCKTLVNRARADVYRKNLWSFQMFEANWTSPPQINAGTVTVTQGSNQVVFDATAAAVINAVGSVPSQIIQRQFRVGIGTIYNIWGWDGVNTATLDRLYAEPSGSTVAYMIYQCYYAAPMQDFKTWLTVRDIINFNDLILNKNRDWADQRDPQRSLYYIPTHVLPYSVDLNPASPTYRNQMFELWSQPTFQLVYQLWGLRKGVEFVNDGDELPPQLGEDCLMALAKYGAYQWCEANWNPTMGKQKPNYLALMQGLVNNNPKRGGPGEYNRLYGEYRMQDRSAVNNFLSTMRRRWSWPTTDGWYSSVAGYANPGAPY
jgi:hypothetical protein